MSADNVGLDGRLSDLSLLLFFIDLMFSKAPALMHHALISNLKSALRKGKSRREWAHKLEANGVLLRVGQPSFSNVWHLWSSAMFAVLSLLLWPISIFLQKLGQLQEIHLKNWPQTFSCTEAASTWCHCSKPRQVRQAAHDWNQRVFKFTHQCTSAKIIGIKISDWYIRKRLTKFSLIFLGGWVRHHPCCSCFHTAINLWSVYNMARWPGSSGA